jgi:RNA-directed DNA polymerase
MEGRPPMATVRQGLAQQAREQPQHRVGHRSAWLNAAYRRAWWQAIRKEAAYGVAEVSADAAEQHLEETSRELVERRTGKRDRATRVKRRDLPTGNGQRRPLGIPAVEDTRRQRAVARLLDASYEQDVRRCRDGYRPKVRALDAVAKLTITRQVGRSHVVVEADIQGVFGNLQHDGWSRLVPARLEAGALRRLIRTGLKAGMRETDGQVMHPATGIPQGGVRTPPCGLPRSG